MFLFSEVVLFSLGTVFFVPDGIRVHSAATQFESTRRNSSPLGGIRVHSARFESTRSAEWTPLFRNFGFESTRRNCDSNSGPLGEGCAKAVFACIYNTFAQIFESTRRKTLSGLFREGLGAYVRILVCTYVRMYVCTYICTIRICTYMYSEVRGHLGVHCTR